MIRLEPASSRFDPSSGTVISWALWRTLSGSISKAKIRVSPADFNPLAMFEPASPNPTKPTLISLFQFVDIPHTEFGELRAKPVEIHTQFAGFQALAGLLLFSKSFACKPGDFCSGFSSHYDNAIGVCDDHVTRTHPRPGTNDRYVD